MLRLLLWAALSARAADAPYPDLPPFSHKLEAFDLGAYAIKLPKGFKNAGGRVDELLDGNAGRRLWLWGRVAREDGRFRPEQLRTLYEGTSCAVAEGRASTDRRPVKTRFLEGYWVACGAPRSHFTAVEEFSLGWVKVWANSRKTDSRFVLELQTTEPAHEPHVIEVVDRILWSLKEPKERWILKKKPREEAPESARGEPEPELEGERRRWRPRLPRWPWRRKPKEEKEEPVFLY